ncbi:ubiquitin carboxyl-terminal hydrolase 17-like isoform X3 [Aegilops tauschii subsp. strangulata]|uniref:ubiquitin carboxyl-terminal hydrolase 17-like isoform X3 n=1 Tax=Aegilops tauschii subsp. strangulata TaxID=200361 RepID=UPI001ABBF6BB|nr:ubiquitin carboxyl-terminal hydrolase 18-like isoform X2 [Aegilops tauschii subsp. strangulata]
MVSFFAALVAIAVVALVAVMRRAAARKEDVRRTAWIAAEQAEFAERDAFYYYDHHAAPHWTAPDATGWTAPDATEWTAPPVAWPPVGQVAAPPVAWPPVDQMAAPPVAWPAVEQVAATPVAWPPVEQMAATPVAWPAVEEVAATPVAWPAVEKVAATPVAWPAVEKVAALPVAWPPAVKVAAPQVAWQPVEQVAATQVAWPLVDQVAAPEVSWPRDVHVASPRLEQEATTEPTLAAAAGKKGPCAVCRTPTTFRCKRCKSVKYCAVKCQIAHWRQGHKDECHPVSADAREDTTIKVSSTKKIGRTSSDEESVVTGVEQAAESKEMPREKASNTSEASQQDSKEFTFPQVTGHAESADCSSSPTFGKPCKVEGASVSENGSHTQIPAACDPSEKAEIRVVVPDDLPTTKSLVRQQTAPTVVRHHPSESALFPYERFVKLYNFDKVELRPFGLCNLGNSCYANVVLQCLAFTRPLTAYFLEGLHSKHCSQKEWCFLCEFQKLIVEGKRGHSQLSPTGILSHLSDIGSSFGPGKEEDAHEFLRYAIDTMQSASMKEANANGAHKLAEETTLIQLMFGGYLRSKIKCTKCGVSSEHCERILDLTVEIDGDISTLEEALHRFTSSEVLDGDNRYHCTRCKSYERGKKKLTISEAPNILTIALKRYQSGMFGKINKAIRFPEYLNLSSYMSTTDDCSPVYRLYAVVVHRDVMNSSVSGHYVCYVKDSQGKWYEMDDSQVKPVSLKNVRSECAYMLLYARCSPRAPRSLRKLIIAQGLSHTRKARQTAGPESTCLEGRSYSSRHQVLEPTSTSEDSSLFSSSDVGSSGNLSSDNTDSTKNPGSSDQMHPVSTVVMPEEHSRQMSSLNPSSSTQYADQAKVDRLHQLKHQASKGVWDEGCETPSFFYVDQGKYPGSISSSDSSSRSRRSISSSSSCNLTGQRNCRMVGEIDHGPGEGQGHFK